MGKQYIFLVGLGILAALSGCGNDGDESASPAIPVIYEDRTTLTIDNSPGIIKRVLELDPVSFTPAIANLKDGASCSQSGSVTQSTLGDVHSLVFDQCQSDTVYLDGTLSYRELSWAGYFESVYYEANLTIQNTGMFDYNRTVSGNFSLGSSLGGDLNLTTMNLEDTLTTPNTTTKTRFRNFYLTGYSDYTLSYGGDYTLEETNSSGTLFVGLTLAVVLNNLEYYNDYPQNGTLYIVGQPTQILSTVFTGSYSGGTDVNVYLGVLPLFSGDYDAFNLWLNP